MWSFLYLAGYVGRIDRSRRGSNFDSLVRANRAREDDQRRSAPRAAAGGSARAAHLRLIRHRDEQGSN